MRNLKSKFYWCLKNKKRVIKINPDLKLANEHIKKAKHDLRSAEHDVEGDFSDWAVIKSYYAMYHSLLAILFSRGFKSLNHECTISLVEKMIDDNSIGLSKEDIYFIRATEQMTPKDAKSLREEFQYGTKTSVDEKILSELLRKSKEIVEKIEVMLNE